MLPDQEHPEPEQEPPFQAPNNSQSVTADSALEDLDSDTSRRSSSPEGDLPSVRSVNPWQTRALLLVLLLGLGLRVAYIQQIDTPPFSDMADYETMALNLLDGKGLIMSDLYRAYRPPLYPLWIAAVYAWRGIEAYNIYLLQSLMSLATVVLVYLFSYWLFAPPPTGHGETELAREDLEARKWKARTIGLVTAALFCFDETSIFFCGQMLTETLFTLFFVAWAYLLVRGVFRPSLLPATLAGIIGGLGILTRPNFLPIVLGGAYWFFRASRRYYKPPPDDWHRFSLLESPFAPPFVMILYSSLVVSFWTIRNEAVLGQFVPISTNSGVNLYLGHHEGFGYNSFGNKEGIRMRLRAQGSYDEVIESKLFTLAALDFIRRHPREDLLSNLSKIYHLYLAPVSPITAIQPWKWWSYLESPYRPWPWETQRRELRFWPVKDESGQTVMPAHKDFFWREGRLPLVFWGWPMVYLTLAGVVWAWGKGERVSFPLMVIFIYTLVLMIYFANARFRAPLLPFLYPFAAYTVVSILWRLKKRSGQV